MQAVCTWSSRQLFFPSRNQKLGDLSVHVGGGKGKGNDHFYMLAAEVGLFSASLFCELVGRVTAGCNILCVMRQKSLDCSIVLLLKISWFSSSVQPWGWSIGFLKFWETLQWLKSPASLFHLNYNRNPLSQWFTVKLLEKLLSKEKRNN